MRNNNEAIRFEALCATLQRNDPEITEIPLSRLRDTVGRRLGDALQGNHHVSSMNLRLPTSRARTVLRSCFVA